MAVKIAQFIDSPDPGGAETLVLELSKRFAKHGYEPVVYHFANQWIHTACEENAIAHKQISFYQEYKSYKTLPKFIKRFAGLLREDKIQLLHSHLYGAVTACAFVSRKAKIPHVGTFHDVYTLQEKTSRIYLIQLAALLGTHLVAVSADMRNYYLQLARLYKPTIDLVYNGADLARFAINPDKSLRAELALRQDDFVLMSVARLVPVKRHDILLQAMAGLDKDLPVKLVIVGDGPEQKNLNELVARYNLQDKVILTGFRTDIPQLLSIADCYVLASDSEGLSCSIQEAMAASLPAIVTDVGGNHELIENETNGYLVTAGNPQQFSDRIKYLLTSREKVQALSAAARESAMRLFDIEQCVNNYVQVYQHLLADR